MGMSQRLRSLAACRSRSFKTTPSWRLPRFTATASANAHALSRASSATTCSMISQPFAFCLLARLNHARCAPAQVSSTSLVRHRGNDYSVPTTHGNRSVVVEGFVDEVVILAGTDEIARYVRSYAYGVFMFDPLHYLALIENKPGALDQAAPLRGWELPDQFDHLRRLLERRSGNKGKREFIQVLRLMEVFEQELVAASVAQAIKLGALSER